MKYIGGYSILDLTDANVHAQANACYNQDKPVLVYGANGERYFADTITKSGTSIIITKGGKTITIANDNTITSNGDIQNHLYLMNLYDSDNVISLLVKKPLNDYIIETLNDLSDDDKTFLKSLKDISINLIGSMCGSVSVPDSYCYATFTSDTLYIKTSNHEGYFNLNNGTFSDNNDTDSLEITFTQLF